VLVIVNEIFAFSYLKTFSIKVFLNWRPVRKCYIQRLKCWAMQWSMTQASEAAHVLTTVRRGPQYSRRWLWVRHKKVISSYCKKCKNHCYH